MERVKECVCGRNRCNDERWNNEPQAEALESDDKIRERHAKRRRWVWGKRYDRCNDDSE